MALAAVSARPVTWVQSYRTSAANLLERVKTVVSRAWKVFANAVQHPNLHLSALACLAITTSPGSLLTGMVGYACLLHAHIPLLSLHELADRCLSPDANSVRAMLGILMTSWSYFRPSLANSGGLAFLSAPAQALFSLIPMLIGCMLARLAMEERYPPQPA